jgi:hypothetical protein
MHPPAARELPADRRAWAFEPKWDGYRALGHVVGGGLALRSRNGVDMAGWFPELAGLPGALGGPCRGPGRGGGRLRQRAAQVDHGLVPAARRWVREALAPLVVERSPFTEPPAALLGGRWARPGPDDPAPVFVRP